MGGHHDQVRTVLPRILVDGRRGIALDYYAVDLEPLEFAGQIRLGRFGFRLPKRRGIDHRHGAPVPIRN